MKHAILTLLGASVFVATSWAQEQIYRCGNVYTNQATQAEKRKCKLVKGGNVTVVKSRPVEKSVAPVRVATKAADVRNGDKAAAQRARDAEARQIIEAELRKAEVRREELHREYNSGEPEKLGSEARNHERYMERVAELKASIDRTENDIVVLRRELARLPASTQ